jgi:heat-inducible transcriptional repressor
MRLAVAVLAHVSQSASWIAAPQAQQARFRHVELISISELTGLMVLVLQDGSVHQQMMVFAQPVAQQALTRLSNKLNGQFGNMSRDEVDTRAEPDVAPDSLEAEVTLRLLELMRLHQARSSREIYRDGLVHILQQPEFDEINRARRIVQVLEQNQSLEPLFHQASLANGVQVIIGDEGKWDDIRGCSIVLSGYGLPGEAKGALGVLGPMRMRYGRVIPAVRYVAALMNDLIGRLYGE